MPLTLYSVGPMSNIVIVPIEFVTYDETVILLLEQHRHISSLHTQHDDRRLAVNDIDVFGRK